jgi:YgiT-type zinc finger domain-containing protein
MTGEHAKDSGQCPLCGGRLVADQKATIPFVLDKTVVVVKEVPAEVCGSCHEPFMTGEVTDRLTQLLKELRHLQAEVSVVLFPGIPVAA